MNVMLVTSFVSAAVAGALGVGAGLHWRESEIKQLELNHANERIAIQRVSRATLERQQAAVSKAQSDAQLRAVAVGVLLIVLLASLTGCASPSPPPCEPPVAITMPVSPRPMPAVSYSFDVQTDLSQWQQILINATPTTKP